MHEYYVYIVAAVGAVVLIVLLLVAARSRSTAGPAPVAGPDALDVAGALDAEAALNVADALDVVDAVVEAQAHSKAQSQRPPRAVASRALPGRARAMRALPAPVAAAAPASPPALASPPASEQVATELVEAEIVEEGEAIPWPPDEGAQSPEEVETAASDAPEQPAEPPVRVPVVGVRRDDPNVLAAATEAQRNLQEFQSAFAVRKPGQTFAVKVPFNHPGGREFMWVAVRSIADGAVDGRLASDPVEVTELRRGDAVRVKLDDVSDWLYRDADKSAPARGGFTAAAVKAAAVVE
jgi:uncharacterized protein YegJ (DUF2314 family)